MLCTCSCFVSTSNCETLNFRSQQIPFSYLVESSVSHCFIWMKWIKFVGEWIRYLPTNQSMAKRQKWQKIINFWHLSLRKSHHTTQQQQYVWCVCQLQKFQNQSNWNLKMCRIEFPTFVTQKKSESWSLTIKTEEKIN